jgi:hypothetical protein
MKKAFLQQILRSRKTVFSFKDLLLSWCPIPLKTAKARISYYVKSKGLIHLRRGLYAKDKNYRRFELATKIFTPSYISFETVLQSAGIVFQHYQTIFVASYQTREIHCDDQIYSFKKLKDRILTNNSGIEIKENYSIASPERAFLDVLYLNKEYHFDNLSPLDWKKIETLLPIYEGNRRMVRFIKMFRKEFDQK